MIRFLLNLSALALGLMASLNGAAQGFTVTYDFASVSTTTGRTDITLAPTSPGVVFGSFTAVAPAGNPNALSTNPNAGGRFSFTGWPTGATNGSDVFSGSINTGQYYQVTLAPQTNYSLSLTAITFTLQRSGTGIRQYAVRSSADNYADNLAASIEPANTNLQVVSSNIFQVPDAITTAQDGSKVTLSGFDVLTGPVTFRFYGWNAEASGGTFSIDNVRITGSAAAISGAPSITLDTSALGFPLTNVNTVSNPLTYTVKGENLTGPVTIAAAAPFTISDAANGAYLATLVVPATEVVTPKTIYVKFSPAATGSFSGNITNSSNGAADKNVSVTGQANDPANLAFDFESCTSGGMPGSGFTTYSVTGMQQWACSNFGINGGRGVDMNGFSNGAVDNEDWLISPPLGIASLNLPILRFWSRGEFSGPSLQLLVSTNYPGTGNPNSANWTDLQAAFPPATNTWTLTDGVNLSAYKASAPVYIAFKYTSSAELGAARWTVDSISVLSRSSLLTTSTSALNFGEVASGMQSAGVPVNVQAIGYGAISITAPAGYQVSADNMAYSSSIMLQAATAEAGTMVYVRFSPVTKMIKVQGNIHFTGAGLDSNLVSLTGSSYPKSETFDVAAYNLSFFGSNPTNTPTPEKITAQINNIATVFQRINMDVVGVEEVSSDSAFAVLASRLPGYAPLLSNRWSYSFDPPDPNFPPQKIGFMYNTATMQLVEQRVMFVGLYDSVRNGTSHVLDNYPSGTPSSFWASGRLPFMATFDATINGKTRRIRMIDIHAKSASDAASYNRRVYDVKVLKDSLDAYYKNDNIIIVGDYNDRVTGSINAGASSPYKPFVDDNANYTALTYPLDLAGRVSFITGTGLIDHIIASNELQSTFIPNATDIEDPRLYISGYNAATGSDHLPVFTRFNLNADVLPVNLIRFGAQPAEGRVVVSWTATMEIGNSHFMVERSSNGSDFTALGRLEGAVNSNKVTSYQYIDALPLPGISYYRLRQVDADGKTNFSGVVTVNRKVPVVETIKISPNPVYNLFNLNSTVAGGNKQYTARIAGTDGSLLLQASGTISQLNQQINRRLYQLRPGIYLLRLDQLNERHTLTFIKK